MPVSESFDLWALSRELVRGGAGVASYMGIGMGILHATGWRRGVLPPLSLALAVGAAACAPLMAVPGFLLGLQWSLPVLALGAALLVVPRLRHFRLARFPRSPLEVLFLFAIAVAVVLHLSTMLLPQGDYDVLSYHLTLAHGARQGHAWPATSFYSRLPLAMPMLEAPVLAPRATTWDDPGVRVLLLSGLLGAAFLAGRVAGHLGARRHGRRLAVLLALVLPLSWDTSLQAHNDSFVALFALAGFERLLALARQPSPARAFVAGLLCISPAGVKFSALGICAVPFAVVAAVLLWQRRRVLAVVAAGMVLGFLPWAARGVVLGGSPLHPFAGFTPEWTREQRDFVVGVHEPTTPLAGDYWLQALRREEAFGLPLILVPSGQEGSRPLVASPLPLVALLALLDRRFRACRPVLLAIVLGYASFLGAQGNPTRFLLPLPLLCGAVVARVVSAGRPVELVRIGARILVAASLLMGILAHDWVRQRHAVLMGATVVDLLDGATSPDAERLELVERSVGEDVPRLRRLPRGSHVLALFEARERLFPPGTSTTTVWDRAAWASALHGVPDAQAAADAWRRAGYTHVTVNLAELSRLVRFYGRFLNHGIEPGRSLPEMLACYAPLHFAHVDDAGRQVLAELLARTRPGDSPTWTIDLAQPLPEYHRVP